MNGSKPTSMTLAQMRAAEIAKRRAGRPVGSGSKEPVAIRFDHHVLTALRAEGPGWQTRRNAALREWLAQHRLRASGA